MLIAPGSTVGRTISPVSCEAFPDSGMKWHRRHWYHAWYTGTPAVNDRLIVQRGLGFKWLMYNIVVAMGSQYGWTAWVPLRETWSPRQGPSSEAKVILIPCHHLPWSLPGTAHHLLVISQLISLFQAFFFFFFSVFPLSHSLQHPCPASYLPFPSSSAASAPALGLAMLLLSCADLPEFALTFALFHQNEMFSLLIYSSGLCLSNLALAIYFSFPYLTLSDVLYPIPEQSKWPSLLLSQLFSFSVPRNLPPFCPSHCHWDCTSSYCTASSCS